MLENSYSSNLQSATVLQCIFIVKNNDDVHVV